MLEQDLAMPRSRLVVDGYNVTKAAWPTAPLEAQRSRLMGALAPLVARTGAETTVVFDAADTDHRPPVAAPRGVRVLFSPRGVIADDVIRDLVAAEPAGRVVVVVTADQEIARDVVARRRPGGRPGGAPGPGRPLTPGPGAPAGTPTRRGTPPPGPVVGGPCHRSGHDDRIDCDTCWCGVCTATTAW